MSIFIILFILAGFALWDPFQFWKADPKDKNRIAGFFFIAFGVLWGVSNATHFPLWLWAFPVALAVLPEVVPPLSVHRRKLLTGAIVLAAVYLAIVGYRIFPSKKEVPPLVAQAPSPVEVTDVDQKIKALEVENAALKQQIEELKTVVNKL